MPFNPSVTDQRGAMAVQAGANIADTILRGKVAGADGIAQGAQQAGNAIAGGVQDWMHQKKVDDRERANADAGGDFLVRMNILTPDQLSKMQKGPLAKYSASISQGMAQYGIQEDLAKEQRGEQRQMNYLGAQTNAAANLATYKTGLEQSTRYTPSAEEQKRMEASGYVWNGTENKWDTDRSKFQRTDPLAMLMGGGAPSAGGAPAQAAAPAATPTAAPQVTPPALRDGMTATNPQTGKKMVRRNGQWVDVQ